MLKNGLPDLAVWKQINEASFREVDKEEVLTEENAPFLLVYVKESKLKDTFTYEALEKKTKSLDVGLIIGSIIGVFVVLIIVYVLFSRVKQQKIRRTFTQ